MNLLRNQNAFVRSIWIVFWPRRSEYIIDILICVVYEVYAIIWCYGIRYRKKKTKFIRNNRMESRMFAVRFDIAHSNSIIELELSTTSVSINSFDSDVQQHRWCCLIASGETKNLQDTKSTTQYSIRNRTSHLSLVAPLTSYTQDKTKKNVSIIISRKQ